MTTDDLKQIDQLLVKRFEDQDKKFDKRFEDQDKKFDKRFEDQDKKFDKRFDSIDEKLKTHDKGFEAIDQRFVDFGKEIDKKFKIWGDKIIEEFVEFMEENIFPKLETMAEKADIERVERRLDAIAVNVGGHEARLKDIEAIPAIAHQLKVSKKK